MSDQKHLTSSRRSTQQLVTTRRIAAQTCNIGTNTVQTWCFCSNVRQTRPREWTEQEEEEGRRQLVGLPRRRVVKTWHVGEFHNRHQFKPVHIMIVRKNGLQGATASLALAGAMAARSGSWPSRGRRGGCSRRQSVALCSSGGQDMAMHPPCRSTMNSGLRLKSIPFCSRKLP